MHFIRMPTCRISTFLEQGHASFSICLLCIFVKVMYKERLHDHMHWRSILISIQGCFVWEMEHRTERPKAFNNNLLLIYISIDVHPNVIKYVHRWIPVWEIRLWHLLYIHHPYLQKIKKSGRITWYMLCNTWTLIKANRTVATRDHNRSNTFIPLSMLYAVRWHPWWCMGVFRQWWLSFCGLPRLWVSDAIFQYIWHCPDPT